jgi:Pectate lyase superfamily protein
MTSARQIILSILACLFLVPGTVHARVGDLYVSRFGAQPDDSKDDTAAVQRAIKEASRTGARRLIFPAGRYLITSVALSPGVQYSGYGAVIVRPPMQGKWTRTFVVGHAGEADSEKVEILGFSFDGQSDRQGAYKQHQLSHAHFIFLAGDPALPGRLRATIRDVDFYNGVGDGVSIYTNVDATVVNVKARDVFRGGLVVTGGNTRVNASNIETWASKFQDPGGIDFEVDGAGFGGSFKVDAILTDVRLHDGDFDVGLRLGSSFVGRRIRSDKAPFNIYSEGAAVLIEESSFRIGQFDSYANRIVCPGQLTIRNTELIADIPEVSAGNHHYGALNIWWSHQVCGGTQKNQRVRLENVSVKASRWPRRSEALSAIVIEHDWASNNNILEIVGGSISPEFGEIALLRKGGNVRLTNVRSRPSVSFTTDGATINVERSSQQLSCDLVDKKLNCSD